MIIRTVFKQARGLRAAHVVAVDELGTGQPVAVIRGSVRDSHLIAAKEAARTNGIKGELKSLQFDSDSWIHITEAAEQTIIIH